MSKRRSAIRAVAEIVINVDDIARAQRFYEEVLGFIWHSQYPDENPTIVFLTILEMDTPLGRGNHPQLFALIDPHRHPPAKQRFQGLDVTRSSLNHLAFEIDTEDYATEKARLEGLGHAVSEERFPDVKAKALFFRDPEGNTIEFICLDPEAE